MELIPILSTIILVATISTFILAIGAYILFKVQETKAEQYARKEVEQEQAELLEPADYGGRKLNIEEPKQKQVFVQHHYHPVEKPKRERKSNRSQQEEERLRIKRQPAEQRFLKYTPEGYVETQKEQDFRSNRVAVTHSTRKGINQWLIMLIGLVVVTAAVMVFLFILRGVFGKVSVNELVPDGRVIKNVLLGREPNIAILYSDYSRNMLPENNTWLEENITTWERFLGYGDNKFEIITDEEIEKGKHFNYELLILPGAISLSDREIVPNKKIFG